MEKPDGKGLVSHGGAKRRTPARHVRFLRRALRRAARAYAHGVSERTLHVRARYYPNGKKGRAAARRLKARGLTPGYAVVTRVDETTWALHAPRAVELGRAGATRP